MCEFHPQKCVACKLVWTAHKKLASCESQDPGALCPDSLCMYVGNPRRPVKSECDGCRDAREREEEEEESQEELDEAEGEERGGSFGGLAGNGGESGGHNEKGVSGNASAGVVAAAAAARRRKKKATTGVGFGSVSSQWVFRG